MNITAATAFTAACDLRPGDIATYHHPEGHAMTFEVARLLPHGATAYVAWTNTDGTIMQALAGTTVEIFLDVLVED